MSDSRYHLSDDFEARLREIIRDELRQAMAPPRVVAARDVPMTPEQAAELTEALREWPTLPPYPGEPYSAEQLAGAVEACRHLEHTRDLRDLTQAIRELTRALAGRGIALA